MRTPEGGDAPAPRWRCVLFDLDGTLSDPGPGITASITFALRRLGYPEPSPQALRSAVGPGLRESFQRFTGSHDRPIIDALVAAYRERFVPIGMYENALYPGVPALVADCAAAGAQLGLATLKPAVFARRILAHFGLRQHFAAVAGSYLDGRRGEKAMVIRRAMRLLCAEPRETVMIGDRGADVEAARACGLAAIGAEWGYAEAGELQAAGPWAVAAEPGDLRVLLGMAVRG